MRHTAIACLPASLVLIGCTHLQPHPPAPAPEQSSAQQSPATAPGASAAGTSGPTAPPAQPPVAPAEQSNAPLPQRSDTRASKSTSPPTGATQPAAGGANSGKSKSAPQRNAGTAPPAAAASPGAGSASAAAAGTKPRAAAGAGETAPGAAAASPAPPPSLDLPALEQRLKDTRAIGLFTKLSLKNQVDDLLSQVRAFHSKRTATSLGELRQRYDLLLLKVLSLLQDGDPPLAAAIAGSREAIWAILADPQKFATL